MGKPNILFVMVDQMAAQILSAYGNQVSKTPHINQLTSEGVVFSNGYCNSPLCAPSRASLMTGLLPSECQGYDNASDFPSSLPTFAHYLRDAGYRTCLSGKMHFVGPDQMHGFEDRLTSDIYPADFGWVCDWRKPETRFSWCHNMLSVVQAGVAKRTNQLDFDEETSFKARQWLYDHARGKDERPFFLMTSFTHPHDPYAITEEYYHRYSDEEIDMPEVQSIPFEERDPHAQRIYKMCDQHKYDLNEQRIKTARRAYYACVSYIDDKVGELLKTLENIGARDNTVICFTSDHGDMIGERGMWYKMHWFDWCARVPFFFHAPGRFKPRQVERNVSLLDFLPTLLELATGSTDALATPVDGRSLLPVLNGGDIDGADVIVGEYLAECAASPLMMVKKGSFKYIFAPSDPPMLYDLAQDPTEVNNLAGVPAYTEVENDLKGIAEKQWDTAAIHNAVLDNQSRRRFIFGAAMKGKHTAWDFQPFRDATRTYMRNTIKLDDLERSARLPFEAPPAPDAI